jgi:hypothetical protein|tara:strand:+ start:1496 stop:1828 length:333 start_codon:yes stop_codon:yes gene_type:complete
MGRDAVDGEFEDFASSNPDLMNHNILWDLTDYDFLQLDPQSVYVLAGKFPELSSGFRPGLKRAILVKSDLGFGMMRMLELLSEDSISTVLNVFRNREEAIEWLKTGDQNS